VFVHDAVDYMTSEAELRQAMETAFAHCRPGGLALFVPDHTAETFEPVTHHGGHVGPDGRGARYLEWCGIRIRATRGGQAEYAFLLRDADESVQVVHDTHRWGVFARGVWLRLFGKVGFEAEAVIEQTTELRTPRELFGGRRTDEASWPSA
jgi:hypothetical protein